jgi:ATP-binding cassette subfamily B protein
VAAEENDDLSAKGGIFLRARSRRLLGSLMRPHRRALLVATVLIIVVTGFEMCAPYLVSVGIDDGMPAVKHGDWTPIALAAVGIGGSALVGSLLRLKFLTLAGRIGQDMLLELRRRVFNQFQRLPIAFHEKYTSGRVISRLTNDLDALNDLVNSSLDGLISALLNVVVIGALLVFLDPMLAIIVLVCLPVLGWLMVWYTKGSRVAYRRQRETVAACIVQFVETLNGIRAVQSFRREPRNKDIFGKLNQDYVEANAQSMRMFGWFMPGIVGGRRGGDGGRAGLRRPPGDGPHAAGRRAHRLHPLPAEVLRPDAGPGHVLHLLPVRDGRAGEAVRRAGGEAGGARADRAEAAA